MLLMQCIVEIFRNGTCWLTLKLTGLLAKHLQVGGSCGANSSKSLNIPYLFILSFGVIVI